MITNPNFLIPIVLQPDGVNLWYFTTENDFTSHDKFEIIFYERNNINTCVQVAIKNSVDVFYYACIAPLHIYFTEDGNMEKKTFLATWKVGIFYSGLGENNWDENWTLKAEHWKLKTESWSLNAKRWTLNTEHWTLNTERGTDIKYLDVEHWTGNTERGTYIKYLYVYV